MAYQSWVLKPKETLLAALVEAIRSRVDRQWQHRALVEGDAVRDLRRVGGSDSGIELKPTILGITGGQAVRVSNHPITVLEVLDILADFVDLS